MTFDPPPVHHVAVVVVDLDATAAELQRAFGAVRRDLPDTSGGKLRATFMMLPNVRLELIQPLDPDHPIGQWLATHGPGLHHLALEVPNIESALEGLAESSIETRGARPKLGAAEALVVVFDRHLFGGTPIQLVQETAASRRHLPDEGKRAMARDK